MREIIRYDNFAVRLPVDAACIKTFCKSTLFQSVRKIIKYDCSNENFSTDFPFYSVSRHFVIALLFNLCMKSLSFTIQMKALRQDYLFTQFLSEHSVKYSF